MKYKIQRFIRNIALENLMTYIAASMAIIFVGDLLTDGMFTPLLSFNRAAILQGEVWRIITFLMLPQTGSVVWIVFSVYFYFFIGRTVENEWGSHNLTMYFLTGALLLLITGFCTGYTSASYLYFSLFLVYAYLNPRLKLMLFMLIPIEVRWLALVDIIFMLLDFGKAFAIYPFSLSLALSVQLSILAAFVTFAVFFGKDYISRFANKAKHRDFIREMKRSRIEVTRNENNDDDNK